MCLYDAAIPSKTTLSTHRTLLLFLYSDCGSLPSYHSFLCPSNLSYIPIPFMSNTMYRTYCLLFGKRTIKHVKSRFLLLPSILVCHLIRIAVEWSVAGLFSTRRKPMSLKVETHASNWHCHILWGLIVFIHLLDTNKWKI